MSDEAEKSQEGEAQGSSPGGGSKKLLMIFIPGMLVQAALAYFLVTKVVAPPPSQPAVPAQAEIAPEEHGQIYLIEDVIVNPAGSEGRRFVNVTIGLEYMESETGKILEARDIQIRDLLISLFASRTVQELDDVSEKEALKKEILDRLNELLRGARIVRVYFVNFIMQ